MDRASDINIPVDVDPRCQLRAYCRCRRLQSRYTTIVTPHGYYGLVAIGPSDEHPTTWDADGFSTVGTKDAERAAATQALRYLADKQKQNDDDVAQLQVDVGRLSDNATALARTHPAHAKFLRAATALRDAQQALAVGDDDHDK